LPARADANRSISGEETVTRKIGQLTLAFAFAAASQVVVPSPAKAEILNLVCQRGSGASLETIGVWIDPERGTITLGLGRNYASLSTFPVTITPEAYRYTTTLGVATIDRMTGSLHAPDQSPFRCAKGTLSFPARKF
jgi:hypothetical protein